jgi:hypothetical protein
MLKREGLWIDESYEKKTREKRNMQKFEKLMRRCL